MFKTLKPVKKLQSWIASLAVFGRKVRILCNHIHLKISTAFPFWSSPSLELRPVSSLVSLLYLLLFISCFALQFASPRLPPPPPPSTAWSLEPPQLPSVGPLRATPPARWEAAGFSKVLLISLFLILLVLTRCQLFDAVPGLHSC